MSNSTTKPGKKNDRFDALIVGYGPVGATLANMLGQRGYRVAIVEKSTEIYDKPRAITADHEAMRVFQACGLAHEIATQTTPHPGTDFLGARGQAIKRFYPQPPPNPLGWEPAFMFEQPTLEAVLRRGVARFAQVQTFLGTECGDIAQTDHEVQVPVSQVDGSGRTLLRAAYVMACDGARSTVRRQLGAGIDDLNFDEWWLVIDAHLRAQVELPPRCVQYCRPSRPGTYIVGPGTLRRWEIKMLPGETPEDFKDDTKVLAALGTFVDVVGLDIWRVATYRFHALVATQWRDRRVFLMGDAAHQMPPFLGQGMCAGIRDVVNLVWKLDAVRTRGYADTLLDTYSEERMPHVRTIVAHAKAFGLIIGELDEQRADERDRRLAQELASGKSETVRQRFIPSLTGGLIDKDDMGQPAQGAGTLFVQPWVSRERGPATQLDEFLDGEFLLVSTSSDALNWMDDDTSRLWKQLAGQSIVIRSAVEADAFAGESVVERDGVFRDWLSAIGATIVLVRPDHYVYGSASTPTQLRRLVRNLHTSLVQQPHAAIAATAPAPAPAPAIH